jgi:hypothetical protein
MDASSDEQEPSESLTANTWRLTILVIVEFLGSCTLLVSAHHLFMYVLHLEDTIVIPTTKFRIAILFLCDFCTAVLAVIALSALLGSWIELCA